MPIVAIVFLLSITILPLNGGLMVLFLLGAVFMITGMGLFNLGADLAMTPMGEGIGVEVNKSKNILAAMAVCGVLGLLITIAEPDLQVLAEQIPSVPNNVLVLAVAVGVGVFMVIGSMRTLIQVKLSYLLLFFYGLVFLLAVFTPNSFIPAAFDSGGVTTGPMTVPFIMAFGIGMASLRSDKNSGDDSFGLVGLCSIGPILMVLLLGFFFEPSASAEENIIPVITTTRDAFLIYLHSLPEYGKEVAVSLCPIIVMFILFQLKTKRFHRHQLLKVLCGFLYTYAGLVLFLCGVNVGFMPVGQLLGEEIAGGRLPFLLVPIGMVIGYYIVEAEPAVHVLKKQVEEISHGAITQQAIGRSLSIGVALSVALAMLRILTGISILWILAPGYGLALLLSFFVPSIYTGIAFDSGGVASGPMTAAFLLPLAMGACSSVGGNIMEDAFGVVAMVAMIPLITIQVLGLLSVMKKKAARRSADRYLSTIDDSVLYYD